MKNLKVTALILCIIMILSFALTGCGADTVDSGDSSSDATGSKDEGKKEDAVELKWYIGSAIEPTDQDLVEDQITEYLLEKINCTVDIVFVPDFTDYGNALGQKLATGEALDLVFTSSWTGAGSYPVNAPIGNFVALNDYLAEGGALYETRLILGDDFCNATQIDGINYAIPNNKEKAHNWGFLFRKDIVEELNLDVSSVKGVEDLEPILAQVKAAYPEMVALVTATGEAPYRLLDWNTFLSDDVPGALYPDDRNNTVINQFEMPETAAHFKEMKALYDADYIRKDADTYTDWQGDTASGVGFCISQSMKPGKDIEFSSGIDYEFIQVDCTEPVMTNRETSGSMMAIPISSKHPDKAAELLNLANTDKYLNNLLNFGIEGYHFTKVSDTVIELSQENIGWRPNITWVFPNQFMNYVMSNESPDKFVEYEKYNASARPLNNLGFVYNGSEMENIVSAIQAITAEYTPRLYAGAVDDVDAILDEMNNRLYAAGMQELLDDMQAQYDAWLAAQ